MNYFRCLMFLAFISFGTVAFGQGQLQGDSEAVALIEKMLGRLGGKEVWARTRSLFVEYHGWRKNPAQPVVERAWRDLQYPNQRMEIEGSLSELVVVFTPEASWISRDGQVSERDSATHQSDLNFWPYDFYTVIHNLAVGDSRLRLSFEPPMRVNITNQTGEPWGWWEIDATGAPVRWGATYEDEELEYIYGPVKPYGNINFPAWGTAADGFWRFEYTKVDVDSGVIPANLLIPPSSL